MTSINQLVQLPKLQHQFVNLFNEINKADSYSYWAQMLEFCDERWLSLQIAELEHTKKMLGSISKKFEKSCKRWFRSVKVCYNSVIGKQKE